jgi:hypothetical protein
MTSLEARKIARTYANPFSSYRITPGYKASDDFRQCPMQFMNFMGDAVA